MASHSIELQPTAQWIPNRISQSSLEPMTHTVSQLGSVGERTKPTEYAGGTDGSEPSDESRGPIYQEELPPADGGRAAWVYLFVAFMIEALCWGFCFSFGVFQSYYSSHPSFQGSSLIAQVGTFSSGIPYLCSIFMFSICARFPNQRKAMNCAGLAICAAGCIGASFATKPVHLMCTQGIMYGIGTTLLYAPIYSMLNEWFVKRRGMAIGIIYSGTGISGLILPLVFGRLLEKYGFATTLRAWALFLIISLAPAIYFVKGRLPPSQVVAARRINYSFLRNKFFYSFAASNLLQGFAYFLPSIYLPSYATDLSLSVASSTVLLSILNLATVFGQIGFGWYSDHTDVHIPLFMSSFIGALSVYLIWGLSKTLAPLLVFAIIYGVTAGGYSVLWGRFCTKVAGDDSGMSMTLFGVFAAERGLGNILSGPISSLLLGGAEQRGHYAAGKYENMVIFIGTCLLASAFGIGGRLMK